LEAHHGDQFDGTFLTIRECFKSMRGTDWGRVIAVASIAGVRGLKGAGAYSASKHGVIGLIRSFSEDHMTEPFTFNAVCPGYAYTPIIEQNIDLMQKKGLSKQDAMTIMVQANRHARLIGTDKIAEAALWLCANGSRSVNGQTIEIAGGQV
jgi:3-hydroxybutyrate dehydrogenase